VLAEVYVIASVALSLFVLIYFFGPLLSALWSPRTEMLSCTYRFLHHRYTWVLSGLIIALGITWHSLLRFLRARATAQRSITLLQWAGLTWIVVLVLIMTAPWKLLWDNERPRVLVGSEKGYILLERGEDLLLYNRARRTSEVYHGSPAGFVRLPTHGYVFEPENGCPGSQENPPGNIWEAK
jgi:hypothetical protein